MRYKFIEEDIYKAYGLKKVGRLGSSRIITLEFLIKLESLKNVYFLRINAKSEENYVNILSIQEILKVENKKTEVIVENELEKFCDLCVTYNKKIKIYLSRLSLVNACKSLRIEICKINPFAVCKCQVLPEKICVTGKVMGILADFRLSIEVCSQLENKK